MEAVKGITGVDVGRGVAGRSGVGGAKRGVGRGVEVGMKDSVEEALACSGACMEEVGGGYGLMGRSGSTAMAMYPAITAPVATSTVRVSMSGKRSFHVVPRSLFLLLLPPALLPVPRFPFLAPVFPV